MDEQLNELVRVARLIGIFEVLHAIADDETLSGADRTYIIKAMKERFGLEVKL